MAAPLAAALIFAALAVVDWAVAVVLYRGLVGGPDPTAHPDHRPVLATAVVMVAAAGFLRFWPSYLAGLAVWALVARRLGLPPARAALLVALLAAVSLVGRMAGGGVMAAFGW